jgi:UrcA family protein
VATATFALLGTTAQAADPNQVTQVTVSVPRERVVALDKTLQPIKEVSITAHVKYNPVSLTTNSGVALFKDRVLQAARQACDAAAPGEPDDGTCVHNALRAAQPQITAAIERAPSSVNG